MLVSAGRGSAARPQPGRLAPPPRAGYRTYVL